MLQVIGQSCLSFILSSLLFFNMLLLKARTEETEMPVSPCIEDVYFKSPADWLTSGMDELKAP